MIEAEWWEFPDRAAMAKAVADDVGFVVERAVAGRDHALLAVPGGATPEPVFKELAKRKLPWDKVTLTLTDDRLVPASDKLSNAALLDRLAKATGAKGVPLLDADPGRDPDAAARAADARIQALNWPLDLAWLGMGENGHTASIFPGADLAKALDAPTARRVIGVTPDPLPPEAPVARVTLTGPTLASAHALIVVIAGDAKREVLERAIEDGPSSRLPIGRLLAATEAAIDIYWSER